MRPCWKAKGSTGYLFVDRARDRDGLSKQRFKAHKAGKMTVLSRYRRELLDPPAPPLTLPVTVQLLARNGSGPTECWQSVFAGAASNDATSFQALSH